MKQTADTFKDSAYPPDHTNKLGRENLQNGIETPASGSYLYNLHCDNLDWQINADFVGQLYPGAPDKAAARAYEQWPDMPAAEFQAAVRADGSVALRMNAVDKSGVRSIRLDMGDGAVFYDALSSYKYEKAGLYTVTLTVTNNNGGYFAGGSPEVQVLVDDGDAFVWQRVDAAVSPAYPVGDAADAFGAHFESYTFAFAPIRCRGVRLLGHAGGDAHFISVAELEAYGAES